MSQASGFRSLTLPTKLAALGALFLVHNVPVRAEVICHYDYGPCEGSKCGSTRRQLNVYHCVDTVTGAEWGTPGESGCCSMSA